MLHIRLYTKYGEKHVYLNDHSDHQLSLKRSILYSQSLRMKILHSESENVVKSQILLYHSFIQDNPSQMIHTAWTDTLNITRRDLLNPPFEANFTEPF